MTLPDSPENCFMMAHGRATGEGEDYIHNLASELSIGLNRAGLVIKPDVLEHDLENIAKTGGMDVIRNPELLKTRPEIQKILSHDNIINPEDRYNAILMKAYINAMPNEDDTIANIVRSLAYHFSAGFQSEGVRIDVRKIESLILKTIEHDIEKMPFADSRKILIKSLKDPEKLIQDLCIRLQLAGLLG
jgi:hypothetical protein